MRANDMGGGRDDVNIAQPNAEDENRKAAERESRKKEQEQQKIGEYFSRKYNWPTWKKKFDLDSEEAKNELDNPEEGNLLLSSKDRKWKLLDPGIYELQADKKDKYDILFTADRKVTTTHNKGIDPTSGEFKERTRKCMRFLAANEGATTMKICLDKWNYGMNEDGVVIDDAKKNHNKEIIRSAIQVAREEGLAVSFDDDTTMKFLQALGSPEADEFHEGMESLKTNRVLADMMMGIGDERGLKAATKRLEKGGKLEDLVPADMQTTDLDAAIKEKYSEKIHRKTNDDGTSTERNTQEKMEEVGKELKKIEDRMAELKDIRENLTSGFDAQDKLLQDPEALRKAKIPDKFKGKKAQQYNDRQLMVDDVQAKSAASEGARENTFNAMEKELTDLKKTQALLKGELEGAKFNDTVLTSQELKDKRGKYLERLGKIDDQIKEERKEGPGGPTGELVDARRRHNERSGANADTFYQDVKSKIQQEQRVSPPQPRG
jgi:hypothetical protein